ncbi:MAG: hypothetical protein AAGJ79_12260, partial [Verrucomicrobiota bacterium]
VGFVVGGMTTDSDARKRKPFRFLKRETTKRPEVEPAPVPAGSLSPNSVEVRRAVPVDEGRAYAITTPNEQARFLAGQSGRASSYAALRSTAYWRNHAYQMDIRWKRASGRLGSIRSWQRGALAGVPAAGNTVFYPFGGPDFLYAHSFFPNARTYLLCGLEPVGSVPNLNAMSDGELNFALQGLQTSIASSLDYSYFITKDMRVDLSRTKLRGVLPVLLVYLARTGHTIHAVEAVGMTSSGEIAASSKGGDGIRIRCSTSFGTSRTVCYFRTDLSNSGGDRFHRLMAAHRPGVTFIKSASYLLHSGGFSKTRAAIERYSEAIVQDPSGIPYKYLIDGEWNIRLHGNYEGTLDMFRRYYQADLHGAYQRSGGTRLGFGVGYRFDPSVSSLLVARKSY